MQRMGLPFTRYRLVVSIEISSPSEKKQHGAAT
jgi:hypothetical protein